MARRSFSLPDSGFAAMGKPIPEVRRTIAYEAAKRMELNQQEAFLCIDGMIRCLEKDEPFKAMNLATKYVDMTGFYKLMAILLTA